MKPSNITLVMPCYNVADTLPAVLHAVDQLDPTPARFLCVDDGSTDGTRDILRSHDSAELIEHDTNSGLGVTMNTALSHTETSLFAKIDADIVVPADWLTNMLAAYEESDSALVQGRFIEQETTRADQWRAKYPSPHFPVEPRRNKPINGGGILAETEALRAIEGYDEQFRRAFDDIDLMERLIEAGYDIYYDPSVCATHIRTDTVREVLHTEWAYQNDPRTISKPTSLTDVIDRIPYHFDKSARYIYRDCRERKPARLGLSLLRFPALVAYDLAHVHSSSWSRFGSTSSESTVDQPWENQD